MQSGLGRDRFHQPPADAFLQAGIQPLGHGDLAMVPVHVQANQVLGRVLIVVKPAERIAPGLPHQAEAADRCVQQILEVAFVDQPA